MDQGVRAWRSVALDRQFQLAVLLGPLVWLGLTIWFSPSDMSTTVQTVIMAVLVYPVLEELAFRGFLQTWLYEKPAFRRQPVPGLTAANIVTSVVFAAAHLLNQSPLWALLVYPPSLVFGYFRDRYGLVWPSIVLHCWYNAGFVYFFY